jgi:predicted Zn-dependent protease with MMP-like domain
MDEDIFKQLVTRAVADLPHEFLERLDNIEIVVAELPSNQQLKRAGIKGSYQLLGLYEGVPRNKRGSYYGMVLPDKVTIFRKPIEAVCRTTTEVIYKIRAVIRHEIAHHFGISDARMKSITRD